MSNLCRSSYATALYAATVGLALLASAGRMQAGEFDSFLFDPYPTFSNAFPTFQLASLTPFERVQQPPIIRPTEPFELKISALVKGGLQNKWAGVKKRLPHESKILQRCRTNADACPPPAKRFLAIINKAQTRDGWYRIAEINRSVNLNVRPVDDMTQYGVQDLWATPLMLFKSNAGDCEDYAIAKYVALREIGIAESDLRIIVLHDHATDEDHAVTAVRYDNRWRILDNRTLEIRQDVDITEFDPLFVIDGEGVKRNLTAATSRQQPTKTDARPAAIDTTRSFEEAGQSAVP